MSCSGKLQNALLAGILFSLIGCAQGAFSTNDAASDSAAFMRNDDFDEGPFQIPESSTSETTTTSPAKQDIVSSGTIKPTVYYFPVINEDQTSCSAKTTLFGKNGEALTSVCKSTLATCAMQGSCAVVQNKKLRSFNISGRAQGRDRFFETTNSTCKYGFGVKSSCLDPFYSIAADLSIYRAGDVIYVPAIVGLPLPNGSKHNGYFIVRDTGRSIVGRGRFDFFSGFFSWNNPKNPFRKIGLGDKRTKLTFYKVTGETARAVLDVRDFPMVPPQSPLQ